MPIDDEAKRRRVSGVPPLPDSTLDEEDRSHIAGIYFMPGVNRSAVLPRARYLPFDTRDGALDSEDRLLPVTPLVPTIPTSVPSKRITIGDRLYPFAGFTIDGPSSVASARWRKDEGAWTPVVLGVFTDILSASRFVNEVVNEYGQVLYELEVTDQLSNIASTKVDAVSNITIGVGKSAKKDVKFRPFADSILSEDPSQIASIKYSVSGDTTIAKTAITRPILFTGTHDGAGNSATLIDSTRDFTGFNIRLNLDIVKNTTDGSQGIITAVTSTTVVATLAGGTDNDWDASDAYEIVDGDTLDLIARRFEISFSAQGLYLITLHVADLTLDEATGIVSARISA